MKELNEQIEFEKSKAEYIAYTDEDFNNDLKISYSAVFSVTTSDEELKIFTVTKIAEGVLIKETIIPEGLFYPGKPTKIELIFLNDYPSNLLYILNTENRNSKSLIKDPIRVEGRVKEIDTRSAKEIIRACFSGKLVCNNILVKPEC